MGYSALFVVAFAGVLTTSYFLVRDRTGGSKTAVSIICAKNGQFRAAFGGVSTGPGGIPPNQHRVPVPAATGPAKYGSPGAAASGVAQNGSPGAAIASECANAVVRASSVTAPGGTRLPDSANTQGSAPVPAGLPGTGTFAYLIKAVNASRDHTLNSFLIGSVLALGLVGLLSVGLGWWMAGRALKPVHRITDTARRLSEQTLHDRINLDGPRDELKELADTFDAMLSRLDQAFTSQRRFVANASHELRTPLATERVLVDEALANPDATVGELRGILEQIRANSEENERLINALLTLARSGRLVERWSPVDLASVAESSCRRGAAEATAKHVKIRTDLRPAPSGGDQELVDRVAANLVDNSIRHNFIGGWVLVRTGTEAGQAFLEVSNCGPRIDASTAGNLVEPFRRAGADRTSGGEGFGLGLSIVDAIVSAHGGRLSLRARPEGGLDVRVELRERQTQPDREPGATLQPGPLSIGARPLR
jgi:signal transduction histidine kinase